MPSSFNSPLLQNDFKTPFLAAAAASLLPGQSAPLAVLTLSQSPPASLLMVPDQRLSNMREVVA